MKYSTRWRVALSFMLTFCLGFTSARGATDLLPDSIRYHALDDVGLVSTKKSSKPFKTPASQLSGKYFAQWDNIQSSGGRDGFTAMVNLQITDDGVATMTNFYNLGSDIVITGTYDEATSTLSFPSQKLFTQSPYGDFYLCFFDVDRYGFSTTQPVNFTINSDGLLESESGWVIIVTDSTSTHYGTGMGMCGKTRYYESNAKMSGNIRDIEGLTFNAGEYPLYVYSASEGELTVANFSSQGRELIILLNSDKSVVIEPQVMQYSSYYGPYCVYPAEWSSTKNKSKGLNQNLTGTGTENSVSFGPWGVFRSSALTTCTFGMESSQILLNDGVTISYPTSDAVTFTGEGTEAAPYQIASAADLGKLAKAVNAGETYSGKYFQQTADIDFSAYSGLVRPIGISATVCFDGIFDGNSKTIKNYKLERGASDYSGLFGYCGANSILKNVNLYGTLVSYGKYTGLLAGYTLGSIDNCHVKGEVSSTSDYLGGMVGQSKNISNSSFVGYVTGVAYTGGLVGNVNQAQVTNCHVEGTITTSVSSSSISHAVGGVVGSVSGAIGNIGIVQDCYFLGTAYDKSGYAHLGGVVGTVTNYCRASRCVGLGMLSTAVKSSSVGSCGGVVGTNSYGSIVNCYASNIIQGASESTKVGGIVGGVSYYSSYPVEVRYNVFAGEIVLNGTIQPNLGVYGNCTSGGEGCIAYNYFDAQMLGADVEDSAKSTADMTSGELFAEFSADEWSFAAGRYPVPKYLPESLVGFASAPIFLGEGQKITNVKKNFTLGSGQGVEWKLLDNNSNYVDETESLKIDGNNVSIKDKLAFTYIVARTTTDNGTFTRLYYLSVSPPQFEGEGTLENPYLIKTVDDMRTLNSSITSYNQTFEGDYLRLVNDLDFSGVTDFWGVSDDSVETHFFNGTFDGDGHVIKNWNPEGLVLDESNKIVAGSSRSTIALFGMAGAKSVIKNITIDSSCSIKGYAGLAGIVAITSGKVLNCRNYANITGAYFYISGIAARTKAGASIENCYNSGTITSGYKYSAGIVSDMQEGSEILNCQNDGLITTAQVSENYKQSDTMYAGGIVGVTAKSCVITNCVNNGTINTAATGGGIVAGFASGTMMNNCLSTGSINVITKTANIGALIGDCLSTVSPFAANSYYDSQVFTYGACDTYDVAGTTGLDTRTLTSGTPIDGLSADVYDYEAGAYPVLKIFKDEAATKVLRHIVLTLAEGETSGEIYSSGSLSSYEDLTWSLVDGTISMSISGNNLVLGTFDQPENTTLTAKCGDLYREYELTAFNTPYEGEGTLENPYRITSMEVMKTLSKYTSDYGAGYANKYFVLTTDLDFADVTDFKPIGWTGTNKFMGKFDGQNHKITNLTLKWDDSNSTVGYSYVGLFGTIGTGGELRNLTIESGEISCVTYTGSFAGKCFGTIENCVNYAPVKTSVTNYVGGIVGYLSSGKVLNCTNYGKVTSAGTHAAGIAAYALAGSTISNCLNKAEVSAASGKNHASGIVTVSYGDIYDCRNEGTITAYGYVSGIATTISGSPEVKNCVNVGTLVATNTYVGGIGCTATANVENCYNYSDVSGVSSIGGLFSNVASGSVIKNCSNYGAVSGTKAGVGGLVGVLASATIDSCANYGSTVTSTYYNAGGIIGQVTGAVSEIRNCVNHANVSVTSVTGYAVGGITGQCIGKIYECLNYGSVSSESYSTGGISGQGSGSAYRCINFGNVTSTYDVSSKSSGNVGGIWGHGTGLINDCINYGNVTGKRYVGGIAGYPGSTAKIQRNYFSGVYSTENPSLSGVICHKTTSMSKLVVDSCYYNSELNPTVLQSDAAAEIAIAKTPIEMMTAALGDAFDYHEYSMPTLNAFEETPEANFMAVLMIYRDGESADNLKTRCVSDLLPGLEWSSTDNILIRDGRKFYAAGSVNGEEGIVTLKAGTMSREYRMLLYNDGVVSVDEAVAEKEIVSKRYFSIDGKELVSPENNGVVIECIKYNDGSTYTRKIVVNKR